MSNYRSQKELLIELAAGITASDAHCDDNNCNHSLAVNLAYVLWRLTKKGGSKAIDKDDVDRIINCFK